MANVIQTISKVKRDLGSVSKANTMGTGNFSYNYRSIDDVLNGLHAGLVEHGLVFVPQVRSINQVEAGKGQIGTVVEVAYEVFGPEGDSIVAATIGEAWDNRDKGVNKAFTAAFKVMLTQLLAIPFDTDDPDHISPEPRSDKVSNPGTEKPTAAKSSAPQTKAPNAGKADGGEKTPTAKPVTPSAQGKERICPTCTFAIGTKDTVKKGPDRAFHHTLCLTPSTSAATADDISSIIGD